MTRDGEVDELNTSLVELQSQHKQLQTELSRQKESETAYQAQIKDLTATKNRENEGLNKTIEDLQSQNKALQTDLSRLEESERLHQSEQADPDRQRDVVYLFDQWEAP